LAFGSDGCLTGSRDKKVVGVFVRLVPLSV
jgi:hypothetical protein